MIIVYCIDNNYKKYAELSIKTVKKHNQKAKIVVVSEKLIEVSGADEYFVFDLGGQHRNRGIGDRISNAAYLKLLLPQLPYEKIIFIDGDTICQDSLDFLWNKYVNYIGLCESHNYGKKQAKELGLEKYGLSGMMVMNLQNLRDIDFTTKCFQIEKTIPNLITGYQHDETIINTLLGGSLTFLPQKYNYCYERKYDNPIKYEDVVILHFPGKDKDGMIKYYEQHHF